MAYGNRISGIAAAALALLAATSAQAGELFGTEPVGDTALGEIRGTYSPSTFSVGQWAAIEDNIARNDFRFFGGVGSVLMENWWATDGADLLAANASAVR